MPLSEREERILEEIEKNLQHQDPSLGRTTRRGPHLDRAARLRLGGLLVLVGFLLLIAFFVSGSVTLGVVAFVAMVGGIVLVAGSIMAPASERTSSRFGGRDRLIGALREWEERVRKRNKGS
ncbi:MAG: DUF3040 domain-containing protein [Actinomycetota bacterium]